MTIRYYVLVCSMYLKFVHDEKTRNSYFKGFILGVAILKLPNLRVPISEVRILKVPILKVPI